MGFSINKRLLTGPQYIYDKYLNEKHYLMLEKHWNHFRPGLSPGPHWRSSRRSSRQPSRLGSFIDYKMVWFFHQHVFWQDINAGMKSWSRRLGLETQFWNVSVLRKSGKVSVSIRSRASTSPFYRAALNAGQSSQEKAVCPFVRLSVKRVDWI